MPDEYIKRSDAIEIAAEWCPDDDGSVGKAGDLREMLDELESIPAADVAPQIRCAECPYYENQSECSDLLCKDALELLLKDEYAARAVIWQGEAGDHWYACEACNKPINPGWKYCPECGRELKWDE